MILATICNEGWSETHLPRWLRFAKRTGLELGLVYIGNGDLSRFNAFDNVIPVGSESDNRPFYNSIRMEMPDLFGQETVYCDCDADVYDWPGYEFEGDLAAVESPAKHDDWVRIAPGKPEYNNGLLILKRSFRKEYAEAVKAVDEMKISPRIAGMTAFNWMCLTTGVHAMPYEFSVVWWDTMKIMDSHVVQWCNDIGQAQRLMLEERLRDAGYDSGMRNVS